MSLPSVLPMERTAALTYYTESLTRAAELDVRAAETGEVSDDGFTYVQRTRRWLSRNDLFFLLVVMCKRRDINKDWLFERCREVQAEPNGHLDLWAREHYKSTIITFGLSIQDILASHGVDPEPRYGGREVTIGIFSHTNPIASDFLKQIKFELEGNDDLKKAFPDVLWQNPKREATQWSVDGGITVKRKTNPKEATVEASGLVDGMPTGKHYFILNYDDVVTEKSVSTPEQIQKTTEMWALSDNLGTEGGWRRTVGTIYHLFDTYSEMQNRGSVISRIYPCTKDGTEDFVPENCVLKGPEELARKRRDQGPYVFGAQMLLNPVADKAQGFKEEWLQFWPGARHTGMNHYILVDPASGRKLKEAGAGGATKEQKNTQLDYTVFEVVGLGADRNYYTVDRVRDRLNLTERAAKLFELHKRWKPKGVGYQQYGLEADIEHIEHEMELRNYRFTITPVTNPMSKADRIKRLVPIYEQGRWYELEDIIYLDWEGKTVNLARAFMDEEYKAFPVCKHDDILDCKATILDFPTLDWPKEVVGVYDDTTPSWMKKIGAGGRKGGWEAA